ncbi:LuxR C-terminal-related transcriptional regulator [Nocardiopsis oceani]
MLHGRHEEAGTLDAILAAAVRGDGAALVIRGPAGIGKSALLDHAERSASGMRVLRTAGIETESELPHAGVHALLGRQVERVAALLAPQARALGTAMGMGEVAGTPETEMAGGPEISERSFLVGLAVLTLLSEAAEEQPLLCLVDDAQFLDSASVDALLFTARRLSAERVAFLFAVREPHAPVSATPGLREMRLTGLNPVAASAVLDGAAPNLSGADRASVLDEAEGNPLALHVLSRYRSGTDHAPELLDQRLQKTFTRAVASLPERTRRLLTVAAAEQTGRLYTVLGAAESLGLDAADLRPAEEQDLVLASDGRIAFRHPLIRSAARWAAPLGDWVAAHRAIAEALPASEPDRRAWHLAAAASGPDEDVARLLDRTAERARGSGGVSAAAPAYLRAAELSADGARRLRRTVLAARAEADSGGLGRAAGLVDRLGPVEDPKVAVEVAWIRALINNGLGRPEVAADLLLDAADTAPVSRVAELLRFALRMAWSDSDFARVRLIGDKAMGLAEAEHIQWLAHAVLAVSRTREGAVARIPPEVEAGLVGAQDPRDRLLLARLRLALGDFRAARRLALRLERECREHGAVSILPEVLMVLARCLHARGRYADAESTAHEGITAAEGTGQWQPRLELSALLAEIAAMKGDAERCARLAKEPLEHAVVPSQGQAVGALALLDLGLGHYEAALGRMERLLWVQGTEGGALGSVPLMVEAAVRLGERERGERAAALLEPWLRSEGHGLRAMALQCRALLRDDEDLYRAAQAEGPAGFLNAHATLLYGEWLRRSRRHADARTQLRTALEGFDRIGAAPWVERARGELRASGETRGADVHAPAPAARLTPQELQVVRLAAAGLTNREIGARLFLSPRTVGHHLYGAYPKLGVSSRRELAAHVTPGSTLW